MTTIIKNATWLNEGKFEQVELKIENGVIAEIASHIDVKNEEVIDAGGNFLSPGLIDVHVHLREPGEKRKKRLKRVL
ncbi:hypothetical protein MUB15_16795 [Priestia sp. OVS21]|nr:hypothetical protein [Priestia sp. OVS21]